MSQIEKLLEVCDVKIENWFGEQYRKYPRLVYSSVDIRDNGDIVAPVDTNLFPAGFNNVHEEELENCSRQFRAYIDSLKISVKNIFVLSEGHTRNKKYFENLNAIKRIISLSGFEMTFISEVLDAPMDLSEHFGIGLTLYPFKIIDNIVFVGDLAADIIISNNDFSDGAKLFLENKIKQPVIPEVNLGWFRRKKSEHLLMYSEIIGEFCEAFDLDKFFFSAEFENCGEINFKEKKGVDCVANKVDKLIHKLASEYKRNNISQKPYIYVKAERGTYGMGVMSVSQGADIYEMNKKLRNKMDVIKGGVKNSEVIIQEGISTKLRYSGMPAEMMVYLINGEPVSFITRYHESKDEFNSLNSPGLKFVNNMGQTHQPRQKIYSIIAKLASLAASKEIGCS